MSDLVIYVFATWVLVKSWYQNRLVYLRREADEWREESERLAEQVQKLEVKLGSHDVDWDMNEFLEEGEEWSPFDDRRNEA
tara:strand:- start:18595 stop:18837 length:243 start_codon:yes stop_codon:yes gene_type:complete